VTGIVGPNGCGKSNISDAISWVLGEQSAKSLRGSSMGDVIFAGSQSRQPLAMAEVSLRITGLNGESPDGTPECMVSRRIYRNGESEYLMNGRMCRLRDIHELFMDTGLGSKAYSIIEQGKIGLILSTKPADRRVLIEEAAGITKYRARRRQTALKLEAAQHNLLRVNDIVLEIEKQHDSLKRQAGKARRYRRLKDELIGVERIVFGRRFLELEARARQLETRILAESGRETAATIALESEEAQMAARRTVLYDEEGRLEEARSSSSELTLTVDRLQGKCGYNKEQIAETESRCEQARQESASLEARVGPLEQSLEAHRAGAVRLEGELEISEREARNAETTLQELTAEQSAVEAELDAARDTQVGFISRIATLENTRQAVSENADRATAELEKLAGEGEELRQDQARVRETTADARTREREAEALLADLVHDRDTILARVDESRAKAEALDHEADALQSERDSLAGRLASLEEMVATHSAFDEGVRALLEHPEGLEVLGVVADSIETSSAHEKAVEAFLGDRLQAVLVPDTSHASRGIRHLQASGAGRGTFLPLSPPLGERQPVLAETEPHPSPSLVSYLKRLLRRGWARGAQSRTILARLRPGGSSIGDAKRGSPEGEEAWVKGLLSDFYEVTGPHAAAIRAALPDAVVVETLEDAFELARRGGPVSCVTLAGETIRGSMVEGGRGVKGLLAPRRQIREVSGRRDELTSRLLQCREAASSAAAAAEAGAAKARELEQRIHTAEKSLVAIRHDLAAAQEEGRRLERKAAVLDTERDQAEQEKAAAAVRLAEIEASLQGSEAEKAAGSELLARLGASLAEGRAAAEAAQTRASELRTQLAAQKERAAAAETEGRRLGANHRELAERIEAVRLQVDQAEQHRRELETELAESERLLAEALIRRDQVTRETTVAEDRVRDLRNELEGRELALKERRRDRETLRGAVSELEVGQARSGSDLDHLARESHQALGQTAAEAATTLTEGELGIDKTELETRIEEIRGRLDNIGPVNVLAVEQAQELDERHHFLIAQRQDLLDSIAELDLAIKKIDRTSRERFEEAFQVINQHFGGVFKQLFGGGTAGLSLIDEENTLDSGIDVMAQPPGKRLQNVMLLSGGEKALTAIALLFAIFQYKPSPFCILDEVDAPLDDANIGRFVRMLEGLKQDTQFILITHSRRTMEIADQLYGVTMEEPGVSKLVSVRFSK
jgi:chromosome segregation protein